MVDDKHLAERLAKIARRSGVGNTSNDISGLCSSTPLFSWLARRWL